MINISGLRILIAEDDEDLLEIIHLYLAKKGAVVKAALNGQHALDLFKQFEFDLVLSDIQMPEVDGIELLYKIREINSESPVVLFVTGQSSIDHGRSIELGAAGLLHKPLKFTELFETIDQLMKTGAIKFPAIIS